MKSLRMMLGAVLCLLLPVLSLAAPVQSEKMKPVVRLVDSQAQDKHFRALGYKKRGGVSKERSDRDEREARSFPHFASSFSVGGVTYPFTMVGYTPRSGREAHLRSVIIPLRMNFNYFGDKQDVFHTFDPAAAVTNIVNSPLYKPALYANGFGQFVDQMQRATFWNKMDPGRHWHVTMEAPKVLPTIDIYVTPETGTLFANSAGTLFGDVLIDFMEAQAQTILQLPRSPRRRAADLRHEPVDGRGARLPHRVRPAAQQRRDAPPDLCLHELARSGDDQSAFRRREHVQPRAVGVGERSVREQHRSDLEVSVRRRCRCLGLLGQSIPGDRRPAGQRADVQPVPDRAGHPRRRHLPPAAARHAAVVRRRGTLERVRGRLLVPAARLHLATGDVLPMRQCLGVLRRPRFQSARWPDLVVSQSQNRPRKASSVSAAWR